MATVTVDLLHNEKHSYVGSMSLTDVKFYAQAQHAPFELEHSNITSILIDAQNTYLHIDVRME
jgi:hypothetical protein